MPFLFDPITILALEKDILVNHPLTPPSNITTKTTTHQAHPQLYFCSKNAFTVRIDF
jgi:hypothetical protein